MLQLEPPVSAHVSVVWVEEASVFCQFWVPVGPDVVGAVLSIEYVRDVAVPVFPAASVAYASTVHLSTPSIVQAVDKLTLNPPLAQVRDVQDRDVVSAPVL